MTDRPVQQDRIDPLCQYELNMFRLGWKSSWTQLARGTFPGKYVVSNTRSYATHHEHRPQFDASRPKESWKRHWRLPVMTTVTLLGLFHRPLRRIMDLSVMAPLHSNPELILWSIIGVNVAGFFAWHAPGAPSKFMARNGLLQKHPAHFWPSQLLVSSFSHQNFWHLAINMIVLYQVGAPIAWWMGSSMFLQCYLDSCVLSSLSSMFLLPALLARASPPLPSLGASGAVLCCLGVFSYLAPPAQLAPWFVSLPIGAWDVFLLTLGFNAYAMVARRGTLFSSAGFDYARLVGGSLCGIAYGWAAQKKIEKCQNRSRESSSLVKPITQINSDPRCAQMST